MTCSDEKSNAALVAQGVAASGHSAEYDRRRQREAARQRSQSEQGRQVRPPLPPVHPAERGACERDFRAFCERYFPKAFSRPWSQDHLTVIAAIERAVLQGGLQAIAMPRGSGKTTLCQRAVLWAILYGHRRFVMLICADEKKGEKGLRAIKTELENNVLLGEDFDEVCCYVRELNRTANRAKGQECQGQPTYIAWGATEVVLPTIPMGSKAGGAVIGAGGITSAVRGPVYTQPDGTTIRPDLVLIDDPQTRESAKSESQCEEREAIITADVLGMAGPGESIAALATVTVIYENDMAERLLNRQTHPDWHGQKTRMVLSWPKNAEWWEHYKEFRADLLRAESDMAPLNDLYERERAIADEGAAVAWEARVGKGEVSAIQHAMNLRFRMGDSAFFSECQNEPISKIAHDTELLTADQIAAKLNRHKRGLIPAGCTHLTCFIDVQKAALYWLVTAWEDSFSGSVVDYGAYPDPRRGYYKLADLKRTLETEHHDGHGWEAALHAGLTSLCNSLLGREWPRDGGGYLKVDPCLIDANWGESTSLVKAFCRSSAHAAILIPSHGKAYGASKPPINSSKRKTGEKRGDHWQIPPMARGQAKAHLLVDTHYWKTFIQTRLAVPFGGAGCLSLFGDDSAVHRNIAEHLTAEYRERVTAESSGLQVDEWSLRPERPDNHWLDCLVGCGVGASIKGCALGAVGSERPSAHRPKPANRVHMPAPDGRNSFFVTNR